MIDIRRRENIFLRFKSFKKKEGRIELILWLVPIFLVILSGLLIASTQRQADFADWYQHWIAAVVGLLFTVCLAQLPIQKIRPFLIPLYLITALSLLAVKFIGSSALGAQRWLSIGGVYFQPSEFAKLIIILVLASVLERYKLDRLNKLWKPLFIILTPWFLVFIQPDLGTSLVFGAFLFTMLYWAGMPLEWALIIFSTLITCVLIGVFKWGLLIWLPLMGYLAYRSFLKKRIAAFITIFLHGAIAWISPWLWLNALKDYQRDRLILFLDPSRDPLGGGYHLLQSIVGIGSGGLFGTGLLNGQLTKLRFIPEQHTDFIFSALGEELGFMGTMIVITSFFLFMLRLINVAKQARTDFESLVVIGIGTMFMFQVVVNVFMTIGLGPVTGIPLPFMSYGRTALIVSFMALGLCISVARRSHNPL